MLGCGLLLDAVDFVVNRLGVLKHRIGRQHAVVRRSQAADFVIRCRNHPAVFLCDIQQGFLLTIRAVHLLEAAAREVIHGRAGQRLKGNVVVVVAGGLLGVVRRGNVRRCQAFKAARQIGRLFQRFGGAAKAFQQAIKGNGADILGTNEAQPLQFFFFTEGALFVHGLLALLFGAYFWFAGAEEA